MSLLRLQNIGKIYASEGSIAVGIRGVNLSFDKGEFVAVTGKSGSGKSTLLNVISGMDSYEEGELFVEGRPTSHYLQKEWEEYREKYISFIFQEYNIIDSFTVLENVELSLMGIDDLRERRRRAEELIERVGLTAHKHHKGSKLSGGQKQRTVIARALAKDSPVILADEPTGNLDSQSSKEIIDLLHEVSKDKLVIVVTHNFEQLEHIATRHIRIFDGAVESDQRLVPGTAFEIVPMPAPGAAEPSEREIKRKKRRRDLRNGIMLGGAIFRSKPKLTFFICILLVIAAVGIYVVSSVSNGALEIFEKHYMFTHSEGRLVIVKNNADPFTPEELKSLSVELGADCVSIDLLLDRTIGARFDEIDWSAPVSSYLSFGVKTGQVKGRISGRYPEKATECLVMLPVQYKPYFGADAGDLKIKQIVFQSYGSEPLANGDYAPVWELAFDICGIGYFADNNKDPVLYLTGEGFVYATLCSFLNDGKLSLEDAVTLGENEKAVNIKLAERADAAKADTVMRQNYKQASLFFKSDSDAAAAAQTLRDREILGVPSYSTYQPSSIELLELVLSGFGSLVLWIGSVVFLAFFVNLCTSKSVSSFRPDMAIMRSMGIPVRVIRIGIYVRMFLSLIPAFLAVGLLGILIATVPLFNALFRYLYAPTYILIFGGLVIMIIIITRRQIAKLFGESVKKSIRGGDAA